jgi:uncharacterized membrane protein YdjX (TVP38/TMEM64 family)
VKALIKIILSLATLFALTFVIIKFTGVISIEKIEDWLSIASNTNHQLVALIVIALLFADLFIAVPTLTIMILSGYFLGHLNGAITSIVGVTLAGVTGYLVSYYHGQKLERFIITNPQEREDAHAKFARHGVIMILFSRALPILPEVSACMSGLTKMPFYKFFIAWMISSVPYAVVATYAGSVSSLDNPKPAIFAGITLSTFLWCGWFIAQKLRKVSDVSTG